MIVVCNCGQKSRINDLSRVAMLRCATCKAMLKDEVNRQASRNADMVLEVASYLAGRGEANWTPEETTIAHILEAHERAKPRTV